MAQECTTIATVWPDDSGVPAARYELWENFRPVWRSNDDLPVQALVSGLEYPLATMLALHLARRDQLAHISGLHLPTTDRTPLTLNPRRAHRLYTVFSGQSISLVRYHGSLVADREVSCLDRAGVRVDILDSEWMPSGSAW